MPIFATDVKSEESTMTVCFPTEVFARAMPVAAHQQCRSILPCRFARRCFCLLRPDAPRLLIPSLPAADRQRRPPPSIFTTARRCCARFILCSSDYFDASFYRLIYVTPAGSRSLLAQPRSVMAMSPPAQAFAATHAMPQMRADSVV